MKAVMMGVGSDSKLERFFKWRNGGAFLSRFISSLEMLEVDEVFVVGKPDLKPRLRKWLIEEGSDFLSDVSLRLNNLTSSKWGEIGMLKQVIEQDNLEGSVVVISIDTVSEVLLDSFKKTVEKHLRSPVVGLRGFSEKRSSSVGVLGKNGRIIDFSIDGESQKKECEPLGFYYFPPHFLSQGIPAFIKSNPSNDFLTLEKFIAWAVRNFKVYAHVFRSAPGF